jgi:hypothetical protein
MKLGDFKGETDKKGHERSILPLFLRLLSYVVYLRIYSRMLYMAYLFFVFVFFPSQI